MILNARAVFRFILAEQDGTRRVFSDDLWKGRLVYPPQSDLAELDFPLFGKFYRG